MDHDLERLRRLSALGDELAADTLARAVARCCDPLEAIAGRAGAELRDAASDRLTALREADPELRALAVREIAALELPLAERLSALELAIGDCSRRVRRAVASALEHLAPELEAPLLDAREPLQRLLVRAMRDTDDGVRDRSAAALVVIELRGLDWRGAATRADGHAPSYKELQRVCRAARARAVPGGDLDATVALVDVIVRSRSSERAARHAHLAAEALGEVSALALATLARLGIAPAPLVLVQRREPLPPHSIAALVEALDDGLPAARQRALAISLALAQRGARLADALVDALERAASRRCEDQHALTEAFVRCAPRRRALAWLEHTLRTARSPRPRRQATVLALERCTDDPRARARVLALTLSDEDLYVRRSALQQLAAHPLPTALAREVVAPLLEHGDVAVARGAFEALARWQVDPRDFDPRLSAWLEQRANALVWRSHQAARRTP